MGKIYPFKFLDSYSAKDTELFFGREDEIKSLYQMIFESNLLMVYGASGTGKTSLIVCGLAGKFQPHDWLALYIRRGDNLNASFDDAVAEAGKVGKNTDLDATFKAIYRNSFRPIYLIFDQFEELFIIGDKKEQTDFFAKVKAILNLEQPVKMIFSIREEYVGRLYDFEKDVPQLMRKKLRVELMDFGKVKEVITGASNVPGSVISLKGGEEEGIALSIFTKLGGRDKSDTIQLPYLQVFLDKVYRDMTKGMPDKSDAVFTTDFIDHMPPIGDILGDFLESQVKAISEHPGNNRPSVPVDQLWDILKPFITIEGTKEPKTITDLVKELDGMDETTVKETIEAFVTGRILRYNKDGEIYELAHDALAAKIAGKRSEEELAVLGVERLIKSQVAMKEDARGLLQENQLTLISLYMKKLGPRLNDEDNDLIEKSKNKIRADEQEAKRHLEDMARKTREAQSLALSSAAMINRYVIHDLTKTFAYARYAYEKEPDNLDAQACIYAAIFPDERKYDDLFYQHTLRHQGAVASAVFSPNGKNVMTTSFDGIAKIWDAVTGKVMTTFEGRSADLAPVAFSIASAAFSPDGKRVVTAFGDITAKIWDAETGKEIATLSGHNHGVVWAVFSPDGKRVVTTSYDYAAKIWDATTGKEIATLAGHNCPVFSAEFSPDGKKMVTKSMDNTVKIWDAIRGKEIATIAGGAGFFASAAFSPDGESVILPSKGGSIAKIYDTTKGEEIGTLAGTHSVMSAAFSPDGRSVVTATWDKTVEIWHPTKKGTEMEVASTLKGHTDRVNSAEFSPDGESVVTASDDKTAKIWNYSREIATLAGHTEGVKYAAFSPDGKKVVTVSGDGTAKLWDATPEKKIVSLTLQTPNVWTNRAAFSLDGKRVVTTSNDSTAKIWDAATGKEIVTLAGHTNVVRSAEFSPDRKKMVTTASEDSTVKVWDAATGKELTTLAGHTAGVSSAKFSPDGEKVVTASADRTAKIWDAADGKEIITMEGHSDGVSSAAFSPDGGKVVTTSDDSIAKVWDAITGIEVTTMAAHSAVVFSPDGKKIMTRFHDSLTIWNAATGEEMATWGVDIDFMCPIVFSPDGKSVMASGGKTAKIWDATTGKEIATLAGHTDNVCSAVFSPDGKRVATASGDNTAKIWDIATGKDIATLAGDYLRLAVFSPVDEIVLTSGGCVKIWNISIPDIIKDMEGKIEDLSLHEKAKYGITEKNKQ